VPWSSIWKRTSLACAAVFAACSVDETTVTPVDASTGGTFGGSGGFVEASFGGSAGSEPDAAAGGSAGVAGSAGTAGAAGADAGPISPVDIPGLVLWLRGDLGVIAPAGVDTWTDQSVGSHSFFQPNPTFRPALVSAGINTKPAIDFKPTPGLPDFLEASGLPLPGAFTLLVVVQLDVVPGPNGFLDVFDIGVPGETLRLGFTTSQTIGNVYFGRGGPDYARSQPILDKLPHLYEMTWDGTAPNNPANYTFVADGMSQPVLPGGPPLVLPLDTTMSSFSVGSAANAFNGKLDELIVFDRVLSATEQTALSAEVRKYWALP
jgi:hypothetical protein